MKRNDRSECCTSKQKKMSFSGAFWTRAVMLLMMLAIVGGALTACGGGRTTAALVAQPISVSDGDGHGLSANEINSLAEAIEASNSAHTIREQLVAALRGYDMNASDFNDDELPEAKPEEAVTYALTALKKAGVEVFPYEEKMTVTDVESLVKCFRTTVSVEESMNLLDTVLHWIALGFEWMINVLGFGNFILGTVFFAIVVELLMLPLGIHQQKNSRKQAMLRPKEMAIRKKYAGRNDQVTMQKLNTEIQEMYQREGFSPMAGCLPMLLSLPVVMVLYYIVIDPLKYMMGCGAELSGALTSFATASQAAGGLGIELKTGTGTIELLSLIRADGLSIEGLASFDYFTNGASCVDALNPMLERIPDFSIAGVNFGLNPDFTSPSILLLIPVLTFVLYYGSMKLNRKLSYQSTVAQDQAAGCSNKTMDVTMPLMSAFFTFVVPGAVGMYWAFKSVLGTVKQFILSKAMPLPQFTEADYKAAERELAGKEKNKPQKKSGTKNPNIRSLHHIDDEDYEIPAPAPAKGGKKPAPAPESETVEEAPKTAEGVYGDGVTLKEDRSREERPEADKKAKKPFWKKDKSDSE